MSSGRRAFTLVELVVIIGIVALLAMIQVSAMAGAKGRTKVAMCASNARQLTFATHMDAGENNDKLPVLTGPAVWAWDLQWDVANRLLSYNLEKRNFYCPGTTPRFTDADNYQNAAPSSLWNFSPGSFHIVGYSFAFSGPSSRLTLANQNTTILAEPVRGTPVLPAPPNSERVLVADATLSIGPTPVPASNFTDIAGGFVKPHTSPHLRGSLPDGGNLGFKDGHVAWRKFGDMSVRTSSAPFFWW
jgi:type II secretory pathway pseudopilin PulG